MGLEPMGRPRMEANEHVLEHLEWLYQIGPSLGGNESVSIVESYLWNSNHICS